MFFTCPYVPLCVPKITEACRSLVCFDFSTGYPGCRSRRAQQPRCLRRARAAPPRARGLLQFSFVQLCSVLFSYVPCFLRVPRCRSPRPIRLPSRPRPFPSQSRSSIHRKQSFTFAYNFARFFGIVKFVLVSVPKIT